jgi:formylglycine-generating enzyme required for sulfatase activity
MRLHRALAAVVLTAACTTHDPLFCDQDHPCTDPARPYCDLQGIYPGSEGHGKSCVPNPFDSAQPPDAGDPDTAAGIDATVVVDASPADAAVPAGMVLVPAGDFMMGCNAAVDTECGADEDPYHRVTLSAFFIDEKETTQAEYQACVATGACIAPGWAWDPANRAAYPVQGIPWQLASTYCLWAGKRLPTEAEWEKAARGADGRKYPWGNLPPDCNLASFSDCPTLQPVGSHPSGGSPYGAHDMAGSIGEWVADWYGADYYTSSPATDPQGPPTPGPMQLRPTRGGGYVWDATLLRSSRRYPASSGDGLFARWMGVRCAKSLR